MNSISVRRVLLESGDAIRIAEGVTALVGPNNSGKSTILREIRSAIAVEPGMATLPRKAVAQLELDFEGSPEGYFADLAGIFGLRGSSDGVHGSRENAHVRTNTGAVVLESELARLWHSQVGLGNQFAEFYVHHLDAQSRLAHARSSQSYDAYQELPTTPLQILFSDRNIEAELSRVTKDAFGSGLVLNRYAGSMIKLHVGQTTMPEGSSPQSEEYLSELNMTPLIEDQGDGMKAFVGMVLSIVTGQAPLILIDEPEAFLHPPQARRFGNFLAEFANRGSRTQVVIATHSQDIIAGLISGARGRNSNVSIARVTRKGTNNHIAQLEPEHVREIFEDPLMKHYDMVNGLFSSGVVLCEADSDCTYYRAVTESLCGDEFTSVQQAHFTHCGGKSRMAQAIATFRYSAVPVAAVYDLDVLQDAKEFETLVGAVEADIETFKADRNIVVNAVEAQTKRPRRMAFSSEVDQILEGSSADELSDKEVRKVRNALGRSSGWSDFKKTGGINLSGDALIALYRLTENLEARGVFLVDKGELERFHPEVGQNNKASWLRTVFEKELYRSSPASAMLARISTFLRQSQ